MNCDLCTEIVVTAVGNSVIVGTTVIVVSLQLCMVSLVIYIPTYSERCSRMSYVNTMILISPIFNTIEA